MAQPRLFIFDLDGTLVDSVHLIAQVVNEALLSAGAVSFDVNCYRNWVGHGLRNLVTQAYSAAGGQGVFGEGEFEPWYQGLKKVYGTRAQYETPSYDGILEILTDLKKRSNIYLAVLTNKIEDIAVSIVSALFPNIFDSICGLNQMYPPKPDPTRINELRKVYGVACADCLLIGDSAVDQQTAVMANIGFCAVLWGYWSNAEREQLLSAAQDARTSDTSYMVARTVDELRAILSASI